MEDDGEDGERQARVVLDNSGRRNKEVRVCWTREEIPEEEGDD